VKGPTVAARITRPRLRRAIVLSAIAAVALGLPACANQVPREQLLADSRGGEVAAQHFRTTREASVAKAPVAAGPVAIDVPQTSVTPAHSTAGSAPDTAAVVKVESRGAPAGATHGKAAAAPAATTPGCRSPLSEIALGTVGATSGFIGASLRPGVDAIKAWVADTNARGGLACHPIKYYVADDGGDPARNAALTEQMVSQRKVIAMLYSSDPLSAEGGKSVLERAHVPTIGNEGAAEWFNTSPDFFPVSPAGTKMIVASYAFAGQLLTSDQKAHFGALVCIEVSLCSEYGGDTGAQIAKDNGVTMIYKGSATMVAPDYTSNCQAAKDAGVQALMLAGDNGLISRAIRSCNRINFHPVYTTSPIAITAAAAELPELDGVIVNSVVKPWTANDPQSRRYLAALAKYVPGALPIGSGGVGWACAVVLEAAAKNLPANPTPADVYTGLWTIKNQDFAGYTAPLTYAKNKPASYPVCWWGMEIKNKQWITLNNGTRACKK
jgi:ABC-type branched-subunit amino acid transport system substrate-binding protein